MLISVDEAFRRILEAVRCQRVATMDAPTAAPCAAILAAPVVADRDQPPFDRVAMDGIAVAFRGELRYAIEGIQGAGAPQTRLEAKDNAIEVMTGAILPEGCDTVVPYEHLKMSGRSAEIKPEYVIKFGQNVHRRGADARAGQELLAPGGLLTPPQWALAATVGLPHLKVSMGPSISVIATGDELIPITSTPKDHQIRASNPTAIQAALFNHGWYRVVSHLASDQRPVLQETIEREICGNDIVIITGAVSMGAYDHVPGCLKELGIREIFHKVSQRPGKPLWFGQSSKGTLVWGVPGNPVSVMISVYRYILPAIAKWASPKWRWVPQYARLAQEINFKKNLEMTLFAPARFRLSNEAIFEAWPLHESGSIGSGNVVALAHSDGFVEIPPGGALTSAGTLVTAYQWGKR